MHINEYNIQKIKDLSISGKSTLLSLTKRRYECYKCKLTDIENKKVIYILPRRHFNYLSNIFKNKDRDNIKFFVSDMRKPYRDIARTYFKNTTYVVDKYHWIRQIVWAFENVRKTEQKKFMTMFRKYFKRSKSLLIKKFDYLTDEEKQEVNFIFYKRQAHGIKEDFFEILDFDKKIKSLKDKNTNILYKIKKDAVKMLSNWINRIQTIRLDTICEMCKHYAKLVDRDN